MDTYVRPVPARKPRESALSAPPRRGFLRDLERPRCVWANVTPNWFAAVMGTGIVAVAAASLPEQFPGMRSAATAVWALAAVMLVGLGVLTALHWRQHPATARGHDLSG